MNLKVYYYDNQYHTPVVISTVEDHKSHFASSLALLVYRKQLHFLTPQLPRTQDFDAIVILNLICTHHNIIPLTSSFLALLT